MPKILLIANPVAGRRAGAKIARIEACLRQAGATVELVLTGARGDAREAALRARQSERFDRIVAAGGDGTLNEVVNGLAPSQIPLAFVPLGTTNVFALEVGIPADIETACIIALNGEVRPVCLGRIGSERFLLMAGIGFDAQVVYGVDLRLKRRVGKLAYLLGGLKTLLAPPPPLIEVETEDGRRLRGYGAIIANGRAYAGRFTLTPHACLTEDRLDLCLLLERGRLQLLRVAAAVAAGLPVSKRLALCLQGRHFRLSGEGVPVQIDGDFHGRLPLEFSAEFGELTMVLPSGYCRPRSE